MLRQKSFVSGEPEVRIVNAFARPYENAVATARTCYSSKGIISAEETSGDDLKDEKKKSRRLSTRDRIAKSIYKAGHHTTLQHAHFQFALDRVSRQFLWTFLHSHAFYNSEQVSQRYVEVKPDAVAIPPLEGPALALYEETVRAQMDAYRLLMEELTPATAEAYYRRFPSRRLRPKQAAKDIQKKAQEIARYVLPVATFAYLYHTVSSITLMRYWRLREQYDAPLEQKAVVGKMIDALLEFDPLFGKILEEPLPFEGTLEHLSYTEVRASRNGTTRDECVEEFDAGLDGRVSKLVDAKMNNEPVLAQAVREVLGAPRSVLGDDEAIRLALDPAKNPYLGEALTLGTHSKLMRTLHHPSYTFRKKLSHTADSQDQRHRMTPASRPILLGHLSDEPDAITPGIVLADEASARTYREIMDRTWDAFRRLRRMGVSDEFASYVLPNAMAIRFTESCDLLHLHHKLVMRLCYNAQEEIWRASVDEATQIREINPRIGQFLLPPCGVRAASPKKPFCPEGDRYCGVPVWKIDLPEYERVI